jgi:hypothetical protein
VRQHDQPGVRPDRAGDVGGIDVAAPVETDQRRGRAEVVDAVRDRTQHGVVIETTGDDVPAPPEQAEDHQVEGVGGVVAEDDAIRIGSAEQAADPATGVRDHLLRAEGEVEARAAGAQAAGGAELQQAFEDRGRLGMRGGGVVEVVDAGVPVRHGPGL